MYFDLARTGGADVDGVDIRVRDLVVVIDGVEIVIARVDLHLRLARQLADDRVENARPGVERRALADDGVEDRQLADGLVAGQPPLTF